MPPPAARPFWNPQRKAWTVLLSAFAIFCTLTSAASYAAYRFVTSPKEHNVTAQVVQSNAAFLQRSGLLRTEMLEHDSVLSAGDRITTSAEGPAGIAARLRVGSATVALWRGTAVLVEPDEPGGARLNIEDGQALIDLPQDGPSLFITAVSLPQQAELTAPGRYRIRKLSYTPPITAIAEQNLGGGIEIAAESGLARMGDATAHAGSRLIIDRAIRQEPNHWSLVRDGSFSSYTADEYRATLYSQPNTRHSDTWIVTRQALAQGAMAQSGLFFLRRDCLIVDVPDEDCRNVARLARLGGNEKDSITSIAQTISADVTAYATVTLEADVRIDHQSLSKGGADGTECPLFAYIIYANGTQTGLKQWFCFWAFDNGAGAISDLSYITSQQIPPKTWYHFSTDLRTRIPDLRVIEQLTFYSNGHDYDASVADVSLWAQGLTNPLQP
jgi:hypothetical protein